MKICNKIVIVAGEIGGIGFTSVRGILRRGFQVFVVSSDTYRIIFYFVDILDLAEFDDPVVNLFEKTGIRI